MKTKSIKVQIIKLVLSAIAMIGTLTYLMGISFGWFYNNREVTGTGMGAQFSTSEINILDVKATGVGKVDPDTLNVVMVSAEPSDKSVITITFECMKDLAQVLITFEAPEGCDTPVIVDDGKGGKFYHYFTTEIDIISMKFDDQPVTSGVLNKPIFDENGAIWENTTEVTPMDKEIYRAESVSKGAHTFSVELIFRNDLTHSQNALKNFGSLPGQVSYRKISVKGMLSK